MSNQGDAQLADRFDALLDAAVDAMVLIDNAGLITRFNRAAERVFGYAAEEVVGRNVSMLMPEPFHSEHDGYLARYRATGERRIIGIGRAVVACRRDKSTFPIELSVGEFVAGGERGYVGILRDISERQVQESRLQQATFEADRLRDRLAHAARLGMLGEMVSGIAHEVNQPLAAITNYANACRRMLSSGQANPGELLEVLGKISRQAERAGQVIRGLRSLVKERDAERPMPLELNRVVEDVVGLAEIDLRGSPQRLELQLAQDLPRVLGNAVQIQQVVMNLVRNGAEAMREAQREGTVMVNTLLSSDGSVEIRVADEGPGVDPTIEPRLFDPFLTTKRQGMGLGLSICKSIVQAHGGELTYRRSPQGGAEFTVRLPVMIEEQAP